jgi:hypothetical protein
LEMREAATGSGSPPMPRLTDARGDPSGSSS